MATYPTDNLLWNLESFYPTHIWKFIPKCKDLWNNIEAHMIPPFDNQDLHFDIFL